jgi:D-aminoacyl-tRNA deacylase
VRISAPVIIIISKFDEAGMNMYNAINKIIPLNDKETLKPNESWPSGIYETQTPKDESFKILFIDHSQINTDYLEGFLETKLVIFASKHSSKAGMKAVLVHPLGNWEESFENSGKEKSIGIVNASSMYIAYHAIKKYKKEEQLNDFWLGLEVSHHGPTELNVPAIFMETGGTKDEWNDLIATRVVARAILDVVDWVNTKNMEETNLPAIIGIGGGHYAPSFIKRVDNNMFCVGHMIPKHHTKGLDKDLLKQAWDNTIAEEKMFLIDKKGISGSVRQELIRIFEEKGYKYALTTDYPTGS